MKLASLMLAALSGPALGVATIDWHTIDGGGARSSGGTYTLHGTIGQPDAGVAMTGGSLSVAGGFWSAGGVAPCEADLNGDTVLDIFDVLAFLGLFDGGDPLADWNGDTVLDIFDVLGYLGDFDAGC